MTFADAIQTCMLRSLSFSGRASRAEYWSFLPVGLAIPAITFVSLRLADPSGSGIYDAAWATATLLPLVSVTARRLNDSGFNHRDFNPGVSALASFLLWLMAFQVSWDFVGSFISATFAAGQDGPGLMFAVLLFSPIFAATLLCAAASFIFGLFYGPMLFGHMFLPSEPGPNKYGPNPREVTP